MGHVLVTGASGYLGQWACASLRKAGASVRGLARSPKPAVLSSDVAWVRGDVTSGVGLEEAARGCTHVLHLACLPFGASGRSPVDAEQINALGTVRMLEAARIAGVRHFVYASTAYVYGSRARAPSDEADVPHPDSPYGASKLAGENWCEAYARAGVFSACTLRIFNVYGAAADGSPRPTVETVFLRELLAGRSPVVRGHPDSGRDFVHVSDVMCAFEKAIAGAVGTFNVGTGTVRTLVEVAEEAAHAARVDLLPRVEVTGEPPTRLWADTRRAARDLRFEARVSLAEGLVGLVSTVSSAVAR
jgi:UDP-glucose 4-epimerase